MRHRFFFFRLRFCRSNSWSFEGGEISRTGLLTVPGPEESPFRNHAMLAVGLDEEKQLLQARNSYGPDWGNAGHVYVPLEYVLNTELSYAFRKIVPPPSGTAWVTLSGGSARPRTMPYGTYALRRSVLCAAPCRAANWWRRTVADA